MVGGMLLALVLYFPASHWIAAAANPRWSRRRTRTPVVVETDPGDLLGPVRPGRHRQVRQRLRHRQERARHQGHLLHDPRARPTARRGSSSAPSAVPIAGGEGLGGADLKALKARTGEAIGAELQAAGYPKSADPAQANMTLLIIILLLFVVAATALYGPQAAALVEMFPTRIRYTAMSFPYHVGTGWVGGFLPVTSFALVAITGNIYAGLWYAVVFTAHLGGRLAVFLKETAGRPLAGSLGLRAPVDVDRLLGLGEHAADRQLRALPVGDRLLEQLALLVAGDR